MTEPKKRNVIEEIPESNQWVQQDLVYTCPSCGQSRQAGKRPGHYCLDSSGAIGSKWNYWLTEEEAKKPEPKKRATKKSTPPPAE